jgi:hypothetical protein
MKGLRSTDNSTLLYRLRFCTVSTNAYSNVSYMNAARYECRDSSSIREKSYTQSIASVGPVAVAAMQVPACPGWI